MMHIYAFTNKDGSPIPYYERTFGCKAAAVRWAARDPRRFVTTNVLPKFWY